MSTGPWSSSGPLTFVTSNRELLIASLYSKGSSNTPAYLHSRVIKPTKVYRRPLWTRTFQMDDLSTVLILISKPFISAYTKHIRSRVTSVKWRPGIRLCIMILAKPVLLCSGEHKEKWMILAVNMFTLMGCRLGARNRVSNVSVWRQDIKFSECVGRYLCCPQNQIDG